MIARYLKFVVALTCDLMNPIDFGACRVISNCGVLTFMNLLSLSLICHWLYTVAAGKKPLLMVLWLQLVITITAGKPHSLAEYCGFMVTIGYCSM